MPITAAQSAITTAGTGLTGKACSSVIAAPFA